MRHLEGSCSLCDNVEWLPWRCAPDFRQGGERQFQLVHCTACSLIYQHPSPGSETLEAAYDRGYIPHAPPTPPPPLHLLRRLRLASRLGYPFPVSPVLRWLARWVLPARGRTPPWVPGGTLLDVGCGSGSYLLAMQNLGWKVLGVEPNERAAARARSAGLTVMATTLEDVTLPPSSVDVITFWHVIEHLPDPLATTQYARTLLRPGGRLIVEVPNAKSVQARVFGNYWFHLDQPRHLTMWSPRTLSDLLRQAGFERVTLASVADQKGWWVSLANALTARWRPGEPTQRGAGRWLVGLAPFLAWAEALFGRGAFLRTTAIKA